MSQAVVHAARLRFARPLRAVVGVLGVTAMLLAAPQLAAAAPMPGTPASTLDLPGAPAPAVVTLAPTSGRVAVRWSAATTAGAPILSYTVQMGWGGGPWTDISGPLAATSSSFDASGLTNGIRYVFRVLATSAGGTTPSVTVGAVPAGAPGPVRSLTLGVGTTSVTMRWAAPGSDGGSPLLRYVVHRSVDGSTWSAVTSSLSATATSLRVDGARVGQRIHLRIQAVSAVGRSGWQSVSGVPRAVPAAVGAAASTAGSGQVRVYWGQPASNGSSITRYVVQRLSGGTWRTVATLGASARSHVAERLQNGTSQTFRVLASNALGDGGWSAAVRIAPRAPAGCDASYGVAGSGPCVPIASDVDCSGGRGNGPAYFSGPGYVLGADRYGLDADGDGIACE